MGKPLSCFEDFRRQVLHTLPRTLILMAKHFFPGSPSSCLIQTPCGSGWRLFSFFSLCGFGTTRDLVKVLTMYKSQSPFILSSLLCTMWPERSSEGNEQDPMCRKAESKRFLLLLLFNAGDVSGLCTSGTGVTHGCKLPCGCLELNLDSQEENSAFNY